MDGILKLRCRCGQLAGVLRDVNPERGTRGICYCDDCQAFAHFLGRADEILDEHGGTDIYQTSPARLELTQGVEHLGCVSLTPRLLRWYARCCKTPLGNTLPTGKIPFVGVIHSCLDPAGDSDVDQLLGPVRFRVHGRYARGDVSALGAHERAPLSLLGRFARVIGAAWLRGEHKRSPLFVAATGQPVVAPLVLDEGEVRAIREEVAAARVGAGD